MTDAHQTASPNLTPFFASSSGVTQPRAPSMAHLAWMTSISRYLQIRLAGLSKVVFAFIVGMQQTAM